MWLLVWTSHGLGQTVPKPETGQAVRRLSDMSKRELQDIMLELAGNVSLLAVVGTPQCRPHLENLARLLLHVMQDIRDMKEPDDNWDSDMRTLRDLVTEAMLGHEWRLHVARHLVVPKPMPSCSVPPTSSTTSHD
jgi:uncharacterized protein YjiS (DUF1127 family)